MLLPDRRTQFGHTIGSAMTLARLGSRTRTAIDPDLLRVAVDLCPHGIAVRDGETPLYANAAWESMMADTSRRPGCDYGSRQLATSTQTFEHDGKPFTLALAHEVNDRARAERQLQEAQKLEALGRWVGGVVHDFNNLLTAIMLYSDLVAQAASPGTSVARFNDEIRGVARRGAGLTGQLLSYLRRHPDECTVISVNSLLKGLRDVLCRMIGDDIVLSFNMASDACHIQMDPAKLQQVVFNLALNARDAMPHGGRLSITTSEHDECLGRDKQKCVSLTVADTGEGMDNATQSRMFEPFFTTKSKDKGTGLGLTIVHNIVVEAGGVIRVDSKPGCGTAITVTVPCAQAPQVKHEPVAPMALERCTETILVVEDDLALRSSIVSTLERRGYQVIEASSGSEALEVTGSSAFNIHLLVTDLVLPGMSGRELAGRMLEKRPQMRVLLMSGYGLPAPDDLSDSEAYFEKPFNSEALAAKIGHALATADVSGKNISVER